MTEFPDCHTVSQHESSVRPGRRVRRRSRHTAAIGVMRAAATEAARRHHVVVFLKGGRAFTNVNLRFT